MRACSNLASTIEKVILIFNIHCLRLKQATGPDYSYVFGLHCSTGIFDIGQAISNIGAEGYESSMFSRH